MRKLERVQAALRGDPVDRPPYGFWTHLPGIDLDPVRLADTTAAFAARYDLDFVKSMPNGLYCVEDWGCACDYSDIARGGVARVTRPAVTTAADWRTLRPVDVTQGSFGRELDHLARLVGLVGPDIPVLATVFSPLTIAAKLSNGAHRAHAAADPDAFCAGLEVLAQVTGDFARAAMARGCAGAFFATQDATPAAFDPAAYRRFGAHYDDPVLRAMRDAGGWFNVLHMHGEDILFDALRDYEITALNWHIGETAPSIGAYRAGGGAKPIVGGLVRNHLTQRDDAAVRADIERTIAETGGRGILIAPACVIRHPVDEGTLARAAALIRGCAA
jgi:uroporphyrinogen decarboxylase